MAWAARSPWAAGALIAACATPPPPKPGLDRIQHIIVIYAENRSFDHLYGLFPGANGIANATPEQYTQVDRDGKPLPHLPPVWKGKDADPAYPDALPNKPFRLDAPPVNMPLSVPTRDTIHKFYPQQEQINGGRNDRFVEVSDSGALPMGYYDGSSLPMWKLAQEYMLADNFFMGAFGDSFLNHFWLVCACTPYDPNAPDGAARASSTSRGWLKRTPDSPSSALAGPTMFTPGEFTPDGYALTTNQPPWQPSRRAAGEERRPARGGSDEAPTCRRRRSRPSATRCRRRASPGRGTRGRGTRRSRTACSLPRRSAMVIDNNEKGSPYFVTHHQPFNYFARFAPGHARPRAAPQGLQRPRRRHRSRRPAAGRVLQAAGILNEHPGNTDVMSGDVHIAELVARIKASPIWASTAIIFTYDENGGFWDHVRAAQG